MSVCFEKLTAFRDAMLLMDIIAELILPIWKVLTKTSGRGSFVIDKHTRHLPTCSPD